MSLGPRWSTADPLLPRGFKAVGGALLCVSRCEGKGPPQPVACSKLRGQDFMQRNAFRLSLGEGRHRLRSRKAAVAHSVVLIQRAFRRYLTWKVVWYKAREKQAVVIQKQARRMLVQQRLKHVHQHAAIVQVSYRAHLRQVQARSQTREQCQATAKRRADAARSIQRFWRQHQQQLEQARIWAEWKREQGW